MNRRHLLRLTAAALATRSLNFHAQTAAASLTVGSKPLATVPLDFTGLSYESPQLANPGFFSPKNTELVALYRELCPTGGVLRTGGNLSAFTGWSDGATRISPDQATFDKGKRYWEWDLCDPTIRNGNREAIFTPASIETLAGFLKAANWKLLYGLNFATGTPRQAADEAACVQRLAGSSLIGFQLGNEIDFWSGGFRAKGWNVDQYLAQWQEWVGIIRETVPGAPFAGPDVAIRLDWMERMAVGKKTGVVLLTKHHYAMGPAGNPAMDATHLLGPDPDVAKEIASAQRAKSVSGVSFRNSECNSCFHGGQPGVSNGFASALWGADYMLTLAQGGHAGVNLHGGGDGFYSPITGDPSRGFIRQPLYFGMKLAQQFAGATLVETTLAHATTNTTGYAARLNGRTLVALINKDSTPTAVSLNVPGKQLRELWQLSAPSLDSKTGVTFSKTTLPPRSGSLSLAPYTALVAHYE